MPDNFQKTSGTTSGSSKADGAGGRPATRVRHGNDAQGGTESAAAKRHNETPRPAGSRRPEEGGSPRGRRGAKRRAAELGPSDGVLRPDAVPGVVYQHGGGTDRAVDHGGARRGPGGRLRTVETIPTTTGTADDSPENAKPRKGPRTRKSTATRRTK